MAHDVHARLLIAASVSLVLTALATTARAQSERPNVIVIVGDDHASTVYGAYGNRRVRTPHLDSLARAGTVFTRAHAQSPLCSASRQSILTGKYPHATGVTLLFTPFNDATNVTLAEVFGDAGYATGLIGKQHFNTWLWRDLYAAGPPTFGFDTLVDRGAYRSWLETRNATVPAGVATYLPPVGGAQPAVSSLNVGTLPQAYAAAEAEATFLTSAALGFVDAAGDQPFFLWLAYHEPHAPFAFPLEFAGRHDPADIVLPEPSPEDDQWIPAVYRDMTDRQRRGAIASYYTSVEWLDANVGNLLTGLRERDLAENTVVVYLGDQGYLLGEHGRFEKHTMWREAVEAPLVISAPGLARGECRGEVVELVDVFPTLAALADVPVPSEVQGTSLLPLLRDGTPGAPREAAFAEYLEDNTAMWRTERWKYVYASGKRDLGQGYATGYGPAGITQRLYDLARDPGETTDVAHEHPRVVAELRASLLARFRETHPYAHELPAGLTATGQLAWFCEPRDVGADFGGTPSPVRAQPPAPAAEPHRPLVHFTPPSGWMNDPNGLVYLDGEYHLFYQHYPDSTRWGPMHWGHAVSSDLLDWRHLPIALAPDSLGYVFSGSAVYDSAGRAGFGESLVAAFTYHDMAAQQAGDDGHQSQALAYSRDRGRTWTKFAGNPVLPNPGEARDFRDPDLRWDAARERYVMSLALGDRIGFYGSGDLRTWSPIDTFGHDVGEHEGVWECPDLFPLEVAETGETKWVLLVSVGAGGPNGGSATQYFVGDWGADGFALDPAFAKTLARDGASWVDYGRDNYAGVTYANVPADDGRRLFVGWMNDWWYGQEVPTEQWRGAMTLPRELSLHRDAAGYALRSRPIRELAGLRGDSLPVASARVRPGTEESVAIPGRGAAELVVRFDLSASTAGRLGVELLNDRGERYRIGYDRTADSLFTDRRDSGPVDFAEVFALNEHGAPRGTGGDTLTLRVVLDVASAETFADDGGVVITDTFFPSEPFDRWRAFAEGGQAVLLEGVTYALREP